MEKHLMQRGSHSLIYRRVAASWRELVSGIVQGEKGERGSGRVGGAS